MPVVDDATEITVLQLPKFKAEAMQLIGTEGTEALALYLADHPDDGDVIPDAGGAENVSVRCYAKNVKTDLTADEKKELRRIAANLKGAQ